MIGIEGDMSVMNISRKQGLAKASVHILEHGMGPDVAMAVPSPDMGSQVRSQLESYIEQYRQMMSRYDNIYGQDIRGRRLSQDINDYVAGAFRQAALTSNPTSDGAGGPSNADDGYEKVATDLRARVQALQDYWKLVPSVMHNRDLWSSFLARNGMPADTPHEANVLAAEAALRQELAGAQPNPRWAELASALRGAYVGERDHLVGLRAAHATVPLQPRSTACPPPASITSGRSAPALQPLTSPLGDFYPILMRRFGIEGVVIVRIRIDVTGCVSSRAVVGSSGSDDLDQAALRWTETASFLPGERDHHAIPYVGNLPVNFSLSN